MIIKQKWKSLMAAVIAALLIIISIASYNMYINKQIFFECSANLMSTYEQVNKTFLMFAQRNWNVLNDWSNNLHYLSKWEDIGNQWKDFVEEKETWNYSDFYMFNEECQFWTIDGRKGMAEHVRETFEQVYEEEEPVVSSYMASDGKRKVVFAIRISPIIIEDVTYTSLAVSYDNSVLEEMIGGLAYGGDSDCYIVDSSGKVILSIEPKTEITQTLDNLFEFLEENMLAYDKEEVLKMTADIERCEQGSIEYRYNNRDYYICYQPVNIKEWSIVGIVEENAVNSGMRTVQYTTIIMLSLLGVGVAMIVLIYMLRDIRRRFRKGAGEREELRRYNMQMDQLFNSMTKIVDRFVVCDLKSKSYVYHERRKEPLYPKEGAYDDFVEAVSHSYVVLTDGENVKMTNMLAVDNLRDIIRTKDDSFKFEYCTRDKSAFQIMTILPVEWEDGILTKVMLISQDMGQQHELENLANTDALTELLNKRYFESMIKICLKKKKRFALIYLDLDRFKPVNDTYGHDIGDKLLKEVSHRLQNCINGHDYACRIGGDEFALILNTSSEENSKDILIDNMFCMEKMQQIKRIISAPYFIEGILIEIGVSCGSAVYPDDSEELKTICGIADRRMYEEKANNKEIR